MATIILNNESQVAKPYDQMSIAELAWTIKSDWSKQKGGVHYTAAQQLSAMFSLTTLQDKFVADSGSSVVASFLCNATTWKGEVARNVKKELNKRLKKA